MTTRSVTALALAQDLCDVLNAKEVARRVAVNAAHVAEFGRLLYPHGGQYATFTVDRPGRKYTRVVARTENGGGSVHAFVENSTGDLLKPAGFKAPARGVRYSLADPDSRALAFERCDWAGSYLYHGRFA